MVGTRLVRTKIEELIKRIAIAEKSKKEYADYLYELHKRYAEEDISYSDYLESTHLKRNGKNIQEWINYLENYIKECKKLIRKQRRNLVGNHLAIIFFSFILISLVLISTIYLKPVFTGLAVVQEPAEAVSEANITITTIQQQAILGQPVKWIKTISLSDPSTIKIRLPVEAVNISVNKITKSYSEEALLKEDSSPSQEEPFSSEANLFAESNRISDSSSDTNFRITGAVISSAEGEGFLLKFFRNFGRITGAAIQEPIILQEIEINDTATDYEVEYETPAPYAIEEDIERGKRIKIIGPETVHYENVLAFTNLDENLNIRNPSQVRIHWIENDSFIPITNIQDTNNNGIYDYIEWQVQSLSEQTFDIIVITKADHLDSNREFISDIYGEVIELDNVWSEEIPAEDYVRVTFEIPLDNTKDITIYPRVVSGSPRIEVYEINGNDLIAEFTNINSNEYNKVFLTNLIGEQDTFDLRILDGILEFDHIVDPPAKVTGNTASCNPLTIDDSGSTTTDCAYNLGNSGNTFAAQCTLTITDDGVGNPITNICQGGIQFKVDSITLGGGNAECNTNNGDGSVNCGTTWNANSDSEDITWTLSGCNGDGLGSVVQLEASCNDALNTKITVTVNAAVADNPPQWFDNSTDGTTAGTNIEHRVRWTDDNALSGYIFSFDNGTGTFTNDSFVEMSGAEDWSNVTKGVNITVGSTIQWQVYVNDSSNQLNATDIFSYTTAEPPDTTNPTSEFGTNPVNNSNKSSSTVVFDFKASDNVDIDFIILYGNWSGGWHANYTNISYINDTWLNITVTGISDGKYVWGIFSNDTAGNSDFTDSNRTLTVDTTPPTITIVSPTNSTFSTGDIDYNITVNEALHTAFASVDSGSNFTLDNDSQTNYFNLSGNHQTLSDGFHNITFWVNDTLGNANENTVFFTTDTTPPNIGDKFVNATSVNTNDIVKLNISGVTDNNLDTVLTTITYPNSTIVNVTMSSIGGDWYEINISVGETTGTFYYNTTYVNDTAGNTASNISILSVTVTSANAAPTITFVEAISAVTPNEAGVNYTIFNFTVTDTDGASDINLSSAQARFQLSGETTRLNASCVNYGAVGNSINFTCTVGMWYFDKADTSWTINVTAKDNSSENAENSTTTFQYNSLSAMVISPTALGWDEINPTSTNIGSNNDPIVVNNTGNAEGLSINITGLNLQGETTDTQFIFAANFTVQNVSPGCSGTQMLNATSLNVSSTILQRGNNSLNNNNATSGQEELFFCLTAVNSDLTAQSYSSSAYGSWTVKILLAVAVIPPRKRKKKKKRKEKSELLKSMDVIVSELREMKSFMKDMSEKEKISKKEIIEVLELRQKENVPISIFTKELGGLEALCKYMKENLGMNYSEIAGLLNRDQRTIWTAYKKATEKQKESIRVKDNPIFIPISIFRNRNLTVLESVVTHLKIKGMKYSEIANLINRDQRNIQTIYLRAIKKLKK